MTDTKSSFGIYPRLCIAYFLQFAIWGSWAGALGGYAGDVLKLPGAQIGWLYAAIPFGAIISPLFIAPLADRYFAAQKVVSLLHLLGGLALLAAGAVCQYNLASGTALFAVLMVLILFSGICFMPTIALVNNIVFKHSAPGKAPYVFVFGTIGWIVINLFIAAFLDGAKQPYFLFAGGVCGILLALYALTLPDTPPKGAPKAGEKSDALGLGALKLFKDPSFAIFVLCVFLASIPACNFFFAFQVTFLTQHGYPSPVALTTLNQFSEIFFMSLLPFFIARIGLKWVVVLGLAAWALRYWVFTIPTFEAAVIALLLHGFCYSFLYVAAYMYADKKAPADLKNSVQGLMAFLLLGVGQVLGSLGYGVIRDFPQNAPAINSVASAKAFESLPVWDDVKAANSVWKYLDLGKTVTDFLSPKKDQQETVASDLGSVLDKDADNKITSQDLAAAPDELKIGETTFKKDDLAKLFKEIKKVEGEEFAIERREYLAAQAYNWKGILLPPAGYIAVFFILFVLLGKTPVEGKEEEK